MSLLSRITHPRAMLRLYWILFWAFTVWTFVCVFVPFGQHLANSVQYVTFISHLALVLSMLGAVEASKVVLAQERDADVQQVLDALESSEEA